MKPLFSVTILVALLGAAWVATPALTHLDDSYITLASAHVVLTGNDPHYAVPALVGVTAPAYAALHVGLLASGLDDLTVVRLASAISLVALVVALWWLAAVHHLCRASRLLFVGVVLATGLVFLQAVNGLETGLAMATLVAMLAASVQQRPQLVAIGAGLIPWLRPDAVFVAAAIGLSSIWPLTRRDQIRCVLVACAVTLPFALWVRMDTGTWLPQTMAAKHAYFAEACWPFATKVRMTLQGISSWMLYCVPVSVGVVGLCLRAFGRGLLLAIAATFALYLILLPSGVFHYEGRYQYAITLPFVALGCLWLWQRRGARVRVATVVLIAYGLVIAGLRYQNSEFDGIRQEYLQISRWLEVELPHDGTPLLVQDAGAPAVFTSHRLVEFVGLKTPSSIEIHRALTLQTCGAQRAVAIREIAQRSGARYLVITSDWDRVFQLVKGLREAGVALTLVRDKPASLDNGYLVYRID